MNNKELLSEGFFKKKSYENTLMQKYAQYAPVSNKGLTQTGFNAIDASNTDEMKKRLTKTLGVAIGSNNIRNMANKAIKRFPIIISENVDPSTAVLLKNYLEVQYAEYLNLLISNQIIDLSDYKRNSPDGNIAIQAVENITGTEFGKQRIANKAMTGELSVDDVFQNVPIFQLLRQESKIMTGDENLDNILENALIVDSNNSDKVLNYILNEATLYDYDEYGSSTNFLGLNKALFAANTDPKQYRFSPTGKNGGAVDPKSDFAKELINYNRSTDKEIRKDLIDRGYVYTDAKGFEHYDKLTNTEVVADPNLLATAINKTVGDLLSQNTPAAKYLNDRFQKATWLLQSRIIAGLEYVAYIQHLGLPIRKEVYNEVIKRFPVKSLIVTSSATDAPGVISQVDAKMISEGKRYIPKVVEGITKVRLKDVFKTNVAISAAAGAGIGAGVAGGLVATAASTAFFWPLIPVGVAVGGLGAILANLMKRRPTKTTLVKTVQKYNSWERVEELINEMDDRTYRIKIDAAKWNIKNQNLQNDDEFKILNKATGELRAEELFDFGQEAPISASLETAVNNFKSGMQKIYESVEPVDSYFEEPLHLTESDIEFYKEDTEALVKLLNETDNTLIEKIQKISLSKPADIKAAKKQMPLTVLTYNDDSDYIVPSYATANMSAYGSVEFDRREIKDRKYNTPLTLKVTFRERYSDGKYSDAEMTAVIGILGVITRVPTEEMQAILNANSQGTTIKGIFSGENKESLGDLIASFKAKTDYSKMPNSAETWKNLEKVSQLAMANRMAGKASNNIANAHIIFSQQEIDAVRQETGVDYLRDAKISAALMKRYSAMSLMVANDTLERVFVFDDIDARSWNVIPYDVIRGRDSSDLMASIASKFR